MNEGTPSNTQPGEVRVNHVGKELARAIAERHMQKLVSVKGGIHSRSTSTFLLLGSWTYGFGDRHSDVDLMALLEDETYTRLRKAATRDFVDVYPDVMPSYCKTKSFEALADELDSDPIVAYWIYRNAEVLHGDADRFHALLETAAIRFETNRESWLRDHYVRARRTADWLSNQPNRPNHVTSALLAGRLARTAMRSASLALAEPYPYDKWLSPWTARLPGCSAVHAAVATLFREYKPARTAACGENLYAALRAHTASAHGAADWVESPGSYIVSS